MSEWYFNKEIRTSHVQKYLDKKKIEYKNYFGNDSDMRNDLKIKAGYSACYMYEKEEQCQAG